MQLESMLGNDSRSRRRGMKTDNNAKKTTTITRVILLSVHVYLDWRFQRAFKVSLEPVEIKKTEGNVLRTKLYRELVIFLSLGGGMRQGT